MVVKGIIKSIDVQGNTCVVRMPYFETAGNDEIVATATVSNSPGSYNGYKVDDVVWVAFENDQLECPVIIGKLYLGIEAERADPRGTLNVVDSKVSRTAEIPFDTRLGRNLEPGMPKTLAPYNSLNNIANNLSTAEVNIAQNDREYGNRFSVAFENIEGNRSSIDQTADKLSTEISDRKNADTSLDARITQTATDITNEVAATYVTQDGKSSTEAFGWSLKKDKWEVYKKINNKPTPILVANEEGLEVNGKIEAESGHIGSFTIGEKNNGNSGIYSDNYKDNKGNQVESFSADTGLDETTNKTGTKGVYIGTDGIKLGSNFSVNTSGEVTATSLVIKPENVYLEDEYETDPSTGTQRRKNLKKRISEGDKATETLKEILNQNLANGEDITSTKITDKVMLSPYLIVDAANIRNTLTIGNIDEPLFYANINDPAVTIGGFKVGSTGISSDTDTAKYNTTFGDSAVGDSGVYVGTDGIRLGKTFSVDNEGNVVASSLKLQSNQIDGLDTKLNSMDQATANAQSTADSAVSSASVAQGTADQAVADAAAASKKAEDLAESTLEAAKTETTKKLEAVFEMTGGDTFIAKDWLATQTIYANQIEVDGLNANGITVNGKDSNNNDIVIFSADATAGEVTLGNFTITDDKLRGYARDSTDVNKKWHIAISGSGISLGQSAEDSDDAKFSVAADGTFYAGSGTFEGAIVATNGEFDDVQKFNYTASNPASFSNLSAEVGVVNDLVSQNLKINDCELTAHGGSTATANNITFSATASTSTIGGGTSRKYTVTVSVKKGNSTYKLNTAKTVKVSKARWSDGIFLAERTVTIPAGASSISYSTTRNISSGRDFVMLDHSGNTINPINPLNDGINPTALGGITPTSPTGLIVTPSTATDYSYSSSGMDINKVVYATELRMTMDSSINPSKKDAILYKPIVNATGDTADNAIQYLWGFTTSTITKRTWVSEALPDKMKGKVVSVVVSAVWPHDNAVGKDDTSLTWSKADQAYAAANYWYTDWDDNYIYVYNASASNDGRISVLVCSK